MSGATSTGRIVGQRDDTLWIATNTLTHSKPTKVRVRPMEDMGSSLARREIVATGLLEFDDCPENYRAWKASFPNTTRGLNLTAKEEFDLLLKWFGTK